MYSLNNAPIWTDGSINNLVLCIIFTSIFSTHWLVDNYFSPFKRKLVINFFKFL